MNTMAIDIGGTKLAVALFTGKGFTGKDPSSHELVLRTVRATNRDGGPPWMLQQIADIVGTFKAGDLRARHIDACGIGFGGPVDFARQRVALSTHVEGWKDFPLIEKVQEIIGVLPIIDNDANAASLGEAIYGAGRDQGKDAGRGEGKGGDLRPLFYLTLSTGIGGGIVLPDGTLLRGADSYAGEIGHLTVRPDGPECLCGARGCLERLCCGLWLERDYGKPPEELFLDAAFVESYVENLALGLKAAIMLLNPARIVIGGGIAQAGDRLFVPLRLALRRHITAWSRARIDVVPAVLERDSVLWGALALTMIAPT